MAKQYLILLRKVCGKSFFRNLKEMNKLLFIVIIYGFFSCNDPKPTLSKLLASKCFWDITGDNRVIGGLNSCYQFLPNGKCYFYYYNFYNKKLTDSVFQYDDDDVVVPDLWSTIGDSILVAREYI